MSINSRRDLYFLLFIFNATITCFGQIQKGSDLNWTNKDDLFGWQVCMPDHNTMAVGIPLNDSAGTSSGKVVVYSWSGSAWQKKGTEFTGEDTGRYLGASFSMPDANTIALASNGGGADGGYVKIYKWDGKDWVQKGKPIGEFKINPTLRVSMPDSQTVAIADRKSEVDGRMGCGKVKVFSWDGQSWIQKGASLEGTATGDAFGHAISMTNSNTLAVGAMFANNGRGVVKIYKWDGVKWLNKGLELFGRSFEENFGFSVSMPNSETVAVGVPKSLRGGPNTGFVKIYSWNGESWEQLGDEIVGEAAGDNFGWDISMPNAFTIATCATGNSANSTPGKVRLYYWNGNDWVQKGQPFLITNAKYISISMMNAECFAVGTAENGAVRAYCQMDGKWTKTSTIGVELEEYPLNFGHAVTMPSKNTIAIGASHGTNSIEVRVLDWSGKTWNPRGSKIVINAPVGLMNYALYNSADAFAQLTMPEPNWLVIGAPTYDHIGNNRGLVRVFKWDGESWKQFGQDFYGQSMGDKLGFSISMPDTNTLAIGSPGCDKKGLDAGSTAIFQRDGLNWVGKGQIIIGENPLFMAGKSIHMANSRTIGITSVGLDQNFNNVGIVKIFSYIGDRWVPKGNDILMKISGEKTRLKIFMSDSNTFAISGSSGRTKIFEWNGKDWAQLGVDIKTDNWNTSTSISMPTKSIVVVGGNNRLSQQPFLEIYKWQIDSWIKINGHIFNKEESSSNFLYSLSMPDTSTIAIGYPTLGKGDGYVSILSEVNEVDLLKGAIQNLKTSFGNVLDDFTEDQLLTRFQTKDDISEICNDDYCLSFLRTPDYIVTSYRMRFGTGTKTSIIVLSSGLEFLDDTKERNFYLESYSSIGRIIGVSNSGYDDDGRYFRQGTFRFSDSKLTYNEKSR